MINDPALNAVVIEKDMVDFLTDWQNIKPLYPTIDTLLTSNRTAILDAFMRWQGKHAA
jgi:hypothetical protein